MLLSWQIDMARDLGCERFICLTDAKLEAFEELRDQIQQFGGEFHTISGPLPLVSLLSADQELMVIADGLIADRAQVAALLTGQRGVLVLPDAAGIEAGFERIDAEHAWGGIFVARGQIVEQLAHMPEDSDTVSLLLRLALQSGVKLVPLDAAHFETGEWLLLREGSELAEREQSLLESSAERVSWWEPTRAMSRRIARLLAPDGLDRGPLIFGALSAFSFVAAAVATFSNVVPWALLFLALSILAAESRDGMLRLKTLLRGAVPKSTRKWFGLLEDLFLIGALSWPFIVAEAATELFLPVLTIGMLRLGERTWKAPLSRLLTDRGIFALFMAGISAFDLVDLGLGGISLVILALSLYFQRESQITRA